MSRIIRKAMVYVLVFAMVSMVFSTVPMIVRSTDPVVLHPGYLSGTMTIQGETVDWGRVSVHNQDDYVQAGFDPHTPDGNYEVIIEGNNDYYVLPLAQINEYDTGYHALSNISLPMQEVSIGGEYVNDVWVPDNVDLDIDMEPGYIDATVTVTEGNIDFIMWGAHCRPDIIPDRVYNARKREMGLIEDGTQYYLSGSTVFPVIPWGTDSNGDEVVNNHDSAYLHISAYVRVDGVTFQLPYKYIGTAAGETTEVSWLLDVTKGSISGYVDISDDDPDTEDYPYTYRMNGAATIEGSAITLHGKQIDPRYPWGIPFYYQEYWEYDSDDTFSKELFSGDWELFPEVHFYDPTNNLDSYLSLRGNPATETIADDENTVVNFDINPCYVEGTVSTYGVEPNLDWIIVRADLPQTHSLYHDAWTRTLTNDYRLILNEDSWSVGAHNVEIFYDHDLSYKARAYGTSSLTITDFGIRGVEDPITLTAGQTVEDVDFEYGIAMITLKYQVEGGDLIGLESMIGHQWNAVWPSGINYLSRAQGLPGLQSEGECTMVIPAGLNYIEARAYVSGSQALFGEFWIDVDAGDVIVSDVGAPIVDITAPTGLQHVSSSSVTVEGTATDDTGVTTITVNGESVTFASTNNPDDPNEVEFSTTVSGLSYGENTITVVATDAESGSGSMERTIIRDNDVPEADAGGPYEGAEGTSVSFDASGSSDPQGDALTYRWDFDSDGVWDTEFSTSPSASNMWDDEHTGTVTVEVFDGVKYDTDTATVTVSNVAPTIDSFTVSPSGPVKLGDLTTVSADYTDPGADTLTTTIDWGDETSSAATGDSIMVTHEYLSTGVYTVTLSVTDGDATVETTYQYVVVYDPEGGFVTGGGWIISPEGAYVADETLTGKANFGFVSKYKKGADVPTGNVEFQFKVGDLNFHSKDFDWLVIAGSKAKFKGTGTINGEGSYGFMISAIDGDDDTFRIKIWDKDNDDAVVYDNQIDAEDDDDPTTTLGGGKIVVHKG